MLTFKGRHFAELTTDVAAGEPNLERRITNNVRLVRLQSHAAHLLLLNAPAIFLIDDEGSQVVPDVDPVALYLNLPAT